ncbi:hypothetical protein ID866_7733, partial [Astraeus odoratus]
MTSNDPSIALDELSEQATRLDVNLNSRVIRDDQTTPLRGPYTVVYPGTLQPEQNLKVAVKVLRCGLPSDQGYIKKAVEEVQLWTKLKHENILPVLGITTKYDLTISLVLEWAEKGNAHDYVQDENIDPRPLIAGIAHGLQYLHGHDSGPIVHGDLKGANVLISEKGHALLTDYGLSRLVNSSFSMSVSAGRKDTLNWTAPETLKSEENESKKETDVWAFGVTALELFTRKVPFHDEKDLLGVQRRILSGPPDQPDYNSTCSRMTDGWWTICSLCCELDQSSRPDMVDVVSRIEKLMVPEIPSPAQPSSDIAEVTQTTAPGDQNQHPAQSQNESNKSQDAEDK